ncbi:hypothetical protein [Tenacibaculum crassostreae]|uniref:hypothetical protein n=1 Tax=Tenacibaculum crassostreae TaxID=502683 RepID=UPI0038B4539E
MKEKIYKIGLILFILSVFLFEFMAYNTMVSLKYETEDIADCISLVSGIDLCQTIKILHALAGTSILIIICLVSFRNKTLKQSD